MTAVRDRCAERRLGRIDLGFLTMTSKRPDASTRSKHHPSVGHTRYADLDRSRGEWCARDGRLRFRWQQPGPLRAFWRPCSRRRSSGAGAVVTVSTSPGGTAHRQPGTSRPTAMGFPTISVISSSRRSSGLTMASGGWLIKASTSASSTTGRARQARRMVVSVVNMRTSSTCRSRGARGSERPPRSDLQVLAAHGVHRAAATGEPLAELLRLHRKGHAREH